MSIFVKDILYIFDKFSVLLSEKIVKTNIIIATQTTYFHV